MYLLRTSPCFLSSKLLVFDERVQRILSQITNVSFSNDDNIRKQGSLPVRFGGLGVGSAVQLALSAFLSSVSGSIDLVQRILPSYLFSLPYPGMDVALTLWSPGHDQSPPLPPDSSSQRAWDTPGSRQLQTLF